MIPLDLTQNHIYAAQPQLQNLKGHKIADWFNNKFANGVENMLAKDEKVQAKRQDHHRDARTKQIQDAVSTANYLGDKDRLVSVGNDVVLGTQAVVSAAGGNYWGAALQGAQLAKSAAHDITSTADVWSEEMRKVNDWNE